DKGTQKDDWGEKGTEKDVWDDEGLKDEGDEKRTEDAPWEKEEAEEISPFELSGRFWNRFAQDLKDESSFEDDNFNHSELRLKAEYTPNESINIVLSVDVDYFIYRSGGDWDYTGNIRPYENYFRFSGSNFDLTAGNQFVKWGKADEVSPLDIVNPEDLRDGFVRSREERKIPIPMMDLKLFKDTYKLEALFIPFFTKSKLNLVGRDWAFFNHYEQEVGNFTIIDEDPPNDLHHSEAGIRFSGTFKNLDYSFSYLYTREDLPSIDSLTLPPGFSIDNPDSVTLEDLVRFALLTRQPIRLKYGRQNVMGVEFETTWRDFGLRGDIAYIHKRSFITDRLESIRKPVYSYVLGMDYNGPASFYFNLQFSQEIIQDIDDPILMLDRITSRVNGKISKGFLDENVEICLRYLYNFTREDYYINPSIILNYWKNITIDFGFEIEGGPSNSTLGTFDDNDEVYCIFQYQF
ncbi:MAG: DUF1302 family protein, partial [Thermodesulfobacteriota bacterium]|nr:DUF1302 family protein [Thermodesulfobacteriota bacterium]